MYTIAVWIQRKSGLLFSVRLITQGSIARWWIEMMDSRNKESGGIVETNEQ
ncbi:hypothetical protein K0G57_08295 [Bacteroides fragilis]|nr:hypothetical protein [Bacteroides fragilis]